MKNKQVRLSKNKGLPHRKDQNFSPINEKWEKIFGSLLSDKGLRAKYKELIEIKSININK